MDRILGIDLGTTNCCMAIMEGNEPVVIPNSEGHRTTPAIVGFTSTGERKIGARAKCEAVSNPQNTIYSVKRLMGKGYSVVEQEIGRVPFNISEGENNVTHINVLGRCFSPQEISSLILQQMKKEAEGFLVQEINEAVITVPAYFTDSQRKATREAGEIAGLTVKRILNEPTAAALAYGLDKRHDNLKVAVFDIGGGTLDISILELGNGIFEVKSTNGNTLLGGDDFDQAIIEWLADEFKDAEGIELFRDSVTLQRLKEAAEKAKIELSNVFETEISLPCITSVSDEPKHLLCKLTRAKFEELITNLLQLTVAPCQLAIENAGMKVSDLDEIILVGGLTRIPSIRKMVREFFGKEPCSGVNPDEVVAIGAAIQGGVLSGELKGVLLLDVIPLSLGIETCGGIMTRLIEANTTIPTRQAEVFSTAVDNQSSVEIHILQGERPMANQNKSIGKFHFDNIPALRRGIPKIEVTFDIDANGILNVTSVDQLTEKKHHVRIEASSGLSEEEVNRMKEEARLFADEDKRVKEDAVLINMADKEIFQAEMQLQEFSHLLAEEKKNVILLALDDLKSVSRTQNINDMKKAMVNLKNAIQAAGEKMIKDPFVSGKTND